MIPLLTSAYLAPVHYYTKLLAAPCVVEERAEHYVKQTFRNRCLIATAGVQRFRWRPQDTHKGYAHYRQ